MKKISVIVPVYNVKDYLEASINSIINQDYSDLEIILVDDGSTDGSGLICDEFKLKDNRVVVYHKENGGLSSARNYGLDRCSGDLISFVDSDDVLNRRFYTHLLEILEKTNSDIAVSDFMKVYSLDISTDQIMNESSYAIYDGFDKYNNLFNDSSVITTIMTNKLYKRKIFNDLRFIEGRVHEDEYIVHHILEKCNRIVYSSCKYYYYFQRIGSITKNGFSMKSFDKLSSIEDRINFFKNLNSDFYVSNTCFLYCYLSRNILLHLKGEYKKYRKDNKNNFNKYYKLIRKKDLSFKNNIKLIIFKYFYFIYYFK